jgi:CheY-like chemotaxis protein
MDDIGLQYDIARNGEDAVNQWKSKHYDLILMDVQMPVMDGLTATQTIRKCEEENKFDTIPIIGMTAHALVEDRQKCIDSGMTDYLSKPIDSQQLKEKIYYHLYDSSRRQATA